MALPWVRLDANIATHDKILHLLTDPSPKKWQAVASYMFALAWSGGQGTDGDVYTASLPMIHGNPTTARLLVKYGLWEEATNGWTIRNYTTRQELLVVSEAKRRAQQLAARKTNCKKRHGPDCECWKEGTEAA